MIDKIRKILAEYMDGPGGEPNLADAHDFLLAIQDVVESDVAKGEREIAKPATVTVEGVLVHEGLDPDGDQFDLEGVSFQEFMSCGYLTSRCAVTPRAGEIVGRPTAISRDGHFLRLQGEVFDPVTLALLESGKSLGYGLAGVIEERGGPVIKRCRVRSVALIPVERLTDPLCVVKIVESPRKG